MFFINPQQHIKIPQTHGIAHAYHLGNNWGLLYSEINHRRKKQYKKFGDYI
jgi:hypothetical protein